MTRSLSLLSVLLALAGPAVASTGVQTLVDQALTGGPLSPWDPVVPIEQICRN